MFVLAVLVLHLCDFLIKVRSNEFPGSEKSFYYASNGYRSFLVDPATFSWPTYELQGSKNEVFETFHIPGTLPNHLKGVSKSQRMPHMYAGDMDRKIKLTHQPSVDLPKFYSPYWMSQLYSDSSNSASTKVAMEKPLPLSLFYAKPYDHHSRERVARQEMKSPNVATSSLMEKKVPFIFDMRMNKFPAHLTAEQFLQLQGKEYRMQTKSVVEEPVPIPYPVEKRVPHPVEKPVPYPLEKTVSYPLEKLVPYPVQVPVRTLVEIPVPVPMVKFDPIFIPVREPSTESHAALWVRQNFTSTNESEDLNFDSSINLLTTSVPFDEGQTESTESQFEISSISSHYEQPVSTSPIAVLQNQLLDASKTDSQFAASDKSGDATELTSTSSPSL